MIKINDSEKKMLNLVRYKKITITDALSLSVFRI